jgi:hypothetical protein
MPSRKNIKKKLPTTITALRVIRATVIQTVMVTVIRVVIATAIIIIAMQMTITTAQIMVMKITAITATTTITTAIITRATIQLHQASPSTRTLTGLRAKPLMKPERYI